MIQQLAEERYPYHTGQMVGSITNQILFSETVVDKERAAFIAGYEAATEQCKWAVVDKDEIYDNYQVAEATIPDDFREQMLIVKIIP
jgi:hypothetical protein